MWIYLLSSTYRHHPVRTGPFAENASFFLLFLFYPSIPQCLTMFIEDICNHNKLETKSLNSRMDKENVVHLHSGVLLFRQMDGNIKDSA